MDVTVLRACIMSRKGGVPLNELNRDYKDLVGKNIEFSKAKFKSLEIFLASFPGVSVKGNMVFCNCEETAHIQDMISKQKSNTPKRSRVKTKKTNKRKSIEEHDKQQAAKRPHTSRQINSAGPQPLLPGWTLSKNRSLSLVERHLQNLSYYDNSCVYNEKNQLYNLLFSLCVLLSATDKGLSSIGEYINGTSCWVMALKKQVQNGITFDLKSAKQPKFVLYGHQVVGDDCMMTLARRHCVSTHAYLGTCMEGLGLLDAQYYVVQQPCAPQVLIACGMLDVHKGKPVEEVIKNMQELILCVLLMGGCPVVCNLPPSPLRWINHCIVTFNCWLATLAHVRVVDLYSHFFQRSQLNMNLFQRFPISPGGYPFYTWSPAGQDLVMTTISRAIKQKSIDDLRI